MRNKFRKGKLKMEEMNKEVMENVGAEVVKDASEKLTFGQNCVAYAVAGLFMTGVATVGYIGYKGTKKLVNHIRSKRNSKEEYNNEDAIDIEETDIHEVKNDEDSEEN